MADRFDKKEADMAFELSRLSPTRWFGDEANPMTNLSDEPRGSGAPELLPVTRLQRNIDRLFDDFLTGFGMSRMGGLGNWSGAAANEMAQFLRPSLDVAEERDAYTITAEVPGVSRDDLDVSVSDNLLTISGQKKRERQGNGHGERGQSYRGERVFGAFQRTLQLPADADGERIDAQYRDGVLTITVPRRPDATPNGRRIAIKTE
jgi:HSP20 family protein